MPCVIRRVPPLLSYSEHQAGQSILGALALLYALAQRRNEKRTKTPTTFCHEAQ
jgi:hypothetical protein